MRTGAAALQPAHPLCRIMAPLHPSPPPTPENNPADYRCRRPHGDDLDSRGPLDESDPGSSRPLAAGEAARSEPQNPAPAPLQCFYPALGTLAPLVRPTGLYSTAAA
eukprot:scaffold454_cov124-Isochrysis_galbana.AAC.26